MPMKSAAPPTGAERGRNRRAVWPCHRARRRWHADFGRRQLAPFGVPIVGINHGRLGFLTDLSEGTVYELLPRLLAEYRERHGH